jgi:hypothetical protein
MKEPWDLEDWTTSVCSARGPHQECLQGYLAHVGCRSTSRAAGGWGLQADAWYARPYGGGGGQGEGGY